MTMQYYSPTTVLKELIQFIQSSKHITVSEYIRSINEKITDMRNKSQISCFGIFDQFKAYMQRTQLQYMNQDKTVSEFKNHLLMGLDRFQDRVYNSSKKITEYLEPYIKNGFKILTFGVSHTVNFILKHFQAKRIEFRVILVESVIQNRDVNFQFQQQLNELAKQDLQIISEGAVLQVIQSVDMILVGAEMMSVNCGLVNSIGTAQIAEIAHLFGKKLVVACQFFKFVEKTMFSDKDIEEFDKVTVQMLRETPVEKVYQKYYDFTSPNRIGLVVTELGALTVVQTSDQASLAMANCPPKLQ